MGLDAHVHCDCFERGRLRTPPRPEWGVRIDETGDYVPHTKDLDELIEFDTWRYQEACEHPYGQLLHHRLGNIALIALFREILNPLAEQLPVIVNKVIYSGTHCGDYLNAADVEQLNAELGVLAGVHVSPKRMNSFCGTSSRNFASWLPPRRAWESRSRFELTVDRMF
ncbi:MAG TPA: hypothetical protein VL282_10295 [Tepidisphaeraceae bacterium]|jgi:hypothetical protein|nr:hypothetical protein [Tepidisphaeraceae bacterium]